MHKVGSAWRERMREIGARLPAMLIQPRGELYRDRNVTVVPMGFECSTWGWRSNGKGFVIDFGGVLGGKREQERGGGWDLNLEWSDDAGRNSTFCMVLEIARDVARKLIEARRERDGVPNLPTTGERREYTIVVAA